jgi:hypothetical protein
MNYVDEIVKQLEEHLDDCEIDLLPETSGG